MRSGFVLAALAIGLLIVLALPFEPPRSESVIPVSGLPVASPDPDAVPDPTVGSDVELPTGYRLAFPRDAIAPVYEPAFVPADAVDWAARTLVIGLEIEGEAKAYPVSFLNRREMVIDRLAGIPILVTW